MSNLRIRFKYNGTTNSAWALDGLSTPGTALPISYVWGAPETLNRTDSDIVIATPVKAGVTTYTINTTVGSCPGGSQTVNVNVLKGASFTDAQKPVGSTVCVGDVAIFTGTPSGDNLAFKWQKNTNGGPWTDISTSPYSISNGANSSTLTVSPTDIGMIDDSIRLYASTMLSSKEVCNTVSVPVPLKLNYVWKGTNTIDWKDASNWAAGKVPDDQCLNVYILGNRNHQPTISDAVPGINNLLMMDQAKLTITNTGTLTVAGHITNTNPGSVIARFGTLNLNAPTTLATQVNQSIDPNTFQNNDLYNLNIDKDGARTVTLNGGTLDTLKLYGTLSFTGGQGKNLISNGRLTLRSLASGTARVADLTNNGTGNTNTVTGDVTVERYINIGEGAGLHTKAWDFLAPPTKGPQTILQGWMENKTTPAGYGTIVTGPIGGADIGAGDPSVKVYDPQDGDVLEFLQWKQIPSVTMPVYSPNGYMVFIRGDRSVTSAFADAKPTTLRTVGGLLMYEQKIPLSLKVFTSIGNPYASTIDMRKVIDANTNSINPFFYIWTAMVNGAYGYGNYITYSKVGDDFETTPGGTKYNFIQSGQAFFVQNVGTTGTDLTFQEPMKDAVSNEYWMFRPQSPGTKVSRLRTNLYADNSKGTYLADGTLHEFSSDFNAGVDGKDGRKLTNGGENLAILKKGYKLIIERTINPTENDTLFFKLTGVSKQKYHFEFVAKDLARNNMQPYLVDKFLGKTIPKQMEDTTLINFKVDDEKGSSASDRFMIVFKMAVVPPVTITTITATEKGKSAEVKWHVDNEKDMKQYEVERSFDGMNFSKRETVNAENAGSSNYSWTDADLLPGYYYYRIRSVDNKGKILFTKEVRVLIGNGKPSITIYPNPIRNGIINIQMVNLPTGKYGIRLLNPLGQLVTAKQIEKTLPSSTEKITWNYNLSHGIYNLEITQPDGSVKIIKVMY
jgi:hypothetical protein